LKERYMVTGSLSQADIVNSAAREYIGRGWSVVPVPRGQKALNIPEWQELSLTADQVDEWFVGESNIGILLGESSGGLADVDLDSDENLTESFAEGLSCRLSSS
jgi:hypothetical protein